MDVNHPLKNWIGTRIYYIEDFTADTYLVRLRDYDKTDLYIPKERVAKVLLVWRNPTTGKTTDPEIADRDSKRSSLLRKKQQPLQIWIILQAFWADMHGIADMAPEEGALLR